MNNELIKLANHLDKKGFHKEADFLDSIIKTALNTSYPEGGGTRSNIRKLWERVNAIEKQLALLDESTHTHPDP